MQNPWIRQTTEYELQKRSQKIKLTSKSHLECNADRFHAKNEQILEKSRPLSTGLCTIVLV